jgi:diguanylate cyclase (GGDEF)-like protein
LAIFAEQNISAGSRLVGLLAGALALLLCLNLGQSNGLLAGLQHELTEARAAASSRAPSGETVLVAIDKQSIDYVGSWPWPRRVHARVIDELVKAGAAEIALDIDFSAPSNPEDDRLLGEALERAGGAVILAAFRQPQSVESGSRLDGLNMPVEPLLQHAWPGAVNVLADADGIVRDLPYGQQIGQEFVPSLPALLAGRPGGQNDIVSIDFSIDARQIPVVSIKSLLEGNPPASRLAGKKVIVGASATELRDSLAVPVHGVIGGSSLQLLATETLLQQRDLIFSDMTTTSALSFALLFALALVSVKLRLSWSLLGFLAAAAGVEGVGLWLYDRHAIVAETVPFHVGLLCLAGSVIAIELDGRRVRAAQARVVVDNYRNVLGQVFDDSFDAVVVASGDGVIEFASSEAVRLFAGKDSQDLTGRRVEAVLPAQIHQDAEQLLGEGHDEAGEGGGLKLTTFDAAAAGERQIEYVITRSRLRNATQAAEQAAPEKTAICITARDVTELHTKNRSLEYLARHDPLTGVLRREAFVEMLAERLGKAEQPGKPSEIVVLAVSLNHFAVVNHNFGREVGDKVLVEAANRLAYFAGHKQWVARLDGGTFGVLLKTRSADRDRAQALVDAMLGQMEQALELDGHHIQLKLQIGMAGSWQVTRQADILISSAETALDIAKRSSLCGITWFNSSLGRDIARCRQIERHMWRALERNELSLCFQPQVNLATRKVTGGEALLRWTSDALGTVSPAEFIPIAESSGAIHELGRFALEQACRAARDWPSDVAVSVNVSPVQLDFSDIGRIVRDVLAETGLAAHRLHIELTETSLMTNQEFVAEQIAALRLMGVKIALDDFGTGHSSLDYLAKLPIDKIKIDQSFVRRMLKDTRSQPIIQAVLGLARSLNLQTVCEGIESEDQALLLRLAGSTEGQGYLFGKPMSAQDFKRCVLDSRRTAGLAGAEPLVEGILAGA